MAIGSHKPPVLLIAGPTASGKSALALAAAERIGGVIVNADSAQVYRGLDVLSAAPTPDERLRADHRLYGAIDPASPCSAADWAGLARNEIGAIHRAGKTPILVGGTGLYLRTVLDGIAPVPPIDPKVRASVRGRGVAENRELLLAEDPDAAARLGPADMARIARALEVVLSTGHPLSHWQAQRQGGIGASITLRPLLMLPPRDWLYARCDRRFEAMFESGAVEEVEALLSRNLDPQLPAMRAIGVREIADFIRGNVSREEAMAAGQQSTRRYAKRQYTWFAHQPPADWPRFTKPLHSEMADALALLAPSA